MCSAVPLFLVGAFAVLAFFGEADAANVRTVDATIRDDADLSQFYQLLESNQVANNTLMFRHVTVFAPTNRAFQKYNGSTDNLVLYHMSNLAQTIDELGDVISSELDGNPPLWITRRYSHYPSHKETYINNAKIFEDRSNFRSTIKLSNGDIKKQVLHVISEVLEPVLSNPTAMPIYNPNAFQFLNQSESLDLGNHRVRLFRQCVHRNRKDGVFKADGRYTFFIPVDEGFKNLRPDKVDHKVIDGHVIPNHILFTSSTPNDKPYETLAFTDNIKVTVSFITEQDGKDSRTYVKSNTLMGDPTYATGVVLAEIVKANIPVRNGVVHLIQRPLMVVDTTVMQFLEEKEDGPVYKFYEVIRNFGNDFMSTITRLRDITLFAPSNAAWDDPSLRHILQDKKRLREILNLHYVKQRLPMDKIKGKNEHQVPTAADKKSLYFNVIQGPNGNQTLTVEGGGVNATVITSNIAATNGIIHIIDRVLGVPYTTVLDKLRTDPMLNSTYFLGQRHNFNEQLNDTTKRFTYFAPRDRAWTNAEMMYTSTYKKLFMPEYSYHAKQILERHLIVADQAFTMAKLKEMNYNDTITLPTVRDSLKLRVKEYGDSYRVEWQGKWIPVFRPDVECTNGIIHVIDAVFLKDSDVRVTGGASVIAFTPHLVMIFIAKWLL